MKRVVILVAVVVSMMVCVPLQHAEAGDKVLLIPREGKSEYLEMVLAKDVSVIVRMLEKAGFEVVVATVSGRPVEEGSATLRPDLKLADVKVADYAGIIMPCMAVGLWPGPTVAPEVIEIVKQALAEGKPVGAQDGSVIILAEAGVLKGKKYAFVTNPLIAPYGREKDTRFAGAVYSGSGIVQDGNIITSGLSGYSAFVYDKPDQNADLMRVFIYELKGR